MKKRADGKVDKRSRSLEERLESAREAAKRAKGHELEAVRLLTLGWYAHVSAPSNGSERASDWAVLCVHSPVGKLSWRIPAWARVEVFASVPDAPNDWDGSTIDERTERIRSLTLAQLHTPTTE